MALARDIERLARSFVAQRLDRSYILHYLMESYQLDEAAAEAVLAKVGCPPPDTRPGGSRRAPLASESGASRVKRQSFY